MKITKESVGGIMSAMEMAFNETDKITVSGDGVDKLARVRNILRRAYAAAADLKSSLNESEEHAE